jgi:hypothetical protein
MRHGPHGGRRLMGWDLALDDLEALLDALDACLAADEWRAPLPPEGNTDARPSAPGTPDEQARGTALLERLAGVDARLRAELEGAGRELSQLARRRTAAHSYSEQQEFSAAQL